MNERKADDIGQPTEQCCAETADRNAESCDCDPTPCQETISSVPAESAHWITGTVKTVAGETPRVDTALSFEDHLGTWKVRWSIGRMRYTVEPGLYAIGSPTPESPVLLSANYKLSFDALRSQLGGRDAWILVLDTRGINVWCAAGKGTFGTAEIVRRAEVVRLSEIVSHRKLISPQLGAPGVSAHEVKRQSGFSVVYGPVRAQDLPAFIDAGMKATPEMRQVRFPLRDRIVLAPVETIFFAKYGILIAIGLFVLAGLGPDIFSFSRSLSVGTRCVALFLGAYLAGTILTPALLPWLPGRSFSSKGAWAGVLLVLAVFSYGWMHPGAFRNWLSAVAWLLLIPSVASFLAMNFTGASTYTSLSGVKREMRIAVPVQAASAVVGLGMWLVSRFI